MSKEFPSGIDEQALHIARSGLWGKVNGKGESLFEFAQRAADLGKTDDEKTAALLYITIQHSDITVEDLLGVNFSDGVIETLKHLSKKENESKENYIARLQSDPSTSTFINNVTSALHK